nr:SCO family protein [Allofranklinella schreckenbergeri]
MKAVSWRAAARASRLGMAALAACVALGLAACGAKEEKLRFNSLDLTGASYAQSWAMPDASGQMRTLADFAGKVVFIFFGYAQCPDVCPVTMVEMAQVKEQLGQDAKRLQIVFVTVDPERDTPEIMREYLGNFDPDAVPLIGTPEQVAAMAKDFKVTYQKVPGADENSYTINHTAAGYVYDTQGRLRLYVRYGTPVEQVVADVRQLLKSAPK